MIYIHIPFCDSKCGYCAFYSQIDRLHLAKAYFDALKIDIKNQLFCDTKPPKISSIFIGGGTPNLISWEFYKDIFELLLPLCKANCEISVESNPNLLSKKWLIEMKSMGLNRLSMGVQSFFSDKLALLERNHNKKECINALKCAREIMQNISIDLIYDCALDNEARIKKELNEAINLAPEHISAYSLSIDSNSRFGDSTRYDLLSNETLGYFVREVLQSGGYRQYEVSNYAKDSTESKCKHNLGYWQGKEYFGIGASAVGRRGFTRYSGLNNIESYIANPGQKRIEILSKNDLDFESVFLGLRSEVGVLSSLCNATKAQILKKENMLYEKNKKLYAKDYFLADSLALYLWG